MQAGAHSRTGDLAAALAASEEELVQRRLLSSFQGPRYTETSSSCCSGAYI